MFQRLGFLGLKNPGAQRMIDFMPDWKSQDWRGVAICLASVAVALALTVGLFPKFIPLASPIFFLAVLVSATYGGLASGVLGTALSSICLTFCLFPDRGTVSDALAATSGIAAYIGVGLAISFFAESFRRAQARNRRILELSPDAILILLERKFIYANRAAARLLGGDGLGPMMIGRGPDDFVATDFREAFQAQIAGARRGGLAPTTVRQTWRRLDGSAIEVEVLAAVLPWERSTAVQIVLRDLTERLAALATQARLAAIVQSSDAAIISRDLDGAITSWNPAAEKLFGYSAEEAIGQRVSMLSPIDRQDEAETILTSISRNERVDQLETLRRHKRGHLIEVSLSVSPMRDGQGKFVGAAMIARDISERKMVEREHLELLEREHRAREAAAHSEERYRALADALLQFVWIVQPDGQVEFCNNYWTEYTGLTIEQTRRNGWQMVVHPADLRQGADLRQSFQAGQPFEFEYRFRRAADGAYRWFLSRVVPIRNAAGTIVRWIGTGADIHERRCAAEAVRTSEARLRRLSESNIMGVVFVDDQGRLSYANEAFLRLTGYALNELEAGKLRWRDMTPADWSALDERGLEECRQRGACTPYEKEFYRKDGSRVPVLIGYASYEDPATEFICFVLDLASRKKLEEELRRQAQQLRDADRRKDEFLAMLGHELRNPLAAILTGAQVLRLTLPDDPSTSETQQIIERQAGHMSRLIDDLLDVARITRGKILLRQQTLDVVSLVRSTVDDHRSNFAAGQLSLTVNLPGSPLSVFGDPTRLSQIIGNVLHNAQKYTPAGGSVVVTVRPTANRRWVEISVRDTGAGIPADMFDRIFEPFSQAERNVGARQGGLGLGLALVHGLVELHGGMVRVHSAGIGQGAEFIISLPLRNEIANAGGCAAPRSNLSSCRILLIEDNQDAAKSLEMLLKCAGHQVSVAVDGHQGIQALERLHPDVVLCDIGLPGGMDGYAVARAIRRQPNHVPYLIALTGFGQEEDYHRALEAGFDLHLVKPIDVEALERALCQLAS